MTGQAPTLLIGADLTEEEKAAAAHKASLPSYLHLCVELPLYTIIPATDRDYLSALRSADFQFDCYCIRCKADSTFKDAIRSRGGGAGMPVDRDWMIKPGSFSVNLVCQRHGHRYTFLFQYSDGHLVKYGQLPSMEDIAGADIRKYSSLLKDGYFGELKRATGLASHGIGIGAFVYLRRIFEKLILDHKEIYEVDNGAIENWTSMRIADQIMALKSVLPPALVKNAKAYSILSKGIHELDEEGCRKYFPVVRAAIIEILEQDLRAKEEKRVSDELEAEIAKIAGEL